MGRGEGEREGVGGDASVVSLFGSDSFIRGFCYNVYTAGRAAGRRKHRIEGESILVFLLRIPFSIDCFEVVCIR